MRPPDRLRRRPVFPVAISVVAAVFAILAPSPRVAVPRRPVEALGSSGLSPDAARELIAEPSAGPLRAVVTSDARHDTSRRLRAIGNVVPRVARAGDEGADGEAGGETEPELPGREDALIAAPERDPVVQRAALSGGSSMPAPVQSFKGLTNADNAAVAGFSFWPPDVNGDVGAGFYVEAVNGVLAAYSTADGSRVFGPVTINSLWSGFGGLCESHLDGDPIVLFDELADRWLISQFALQDPNNYHECIAISKTSDPTGQYYRYDFPYQASGAFNDYPKFGVWPDGYYMSANQFTAGGKWAGAGATVVERSRMLSGLSARQVYFDLASQPLSSMLPADVDGAAPPAGAPDIYAQIDDDAWGYSKDAVELWGFHVDWTTTANSTFTKIKTAPVAAFSSNVPDVPQPGTAQTLDPLSDRLMWRLQYRNFGGYETLVVNHAVNSSGHAGVRWYVLDDSGSSWAVAQQGTYSPSGENRWLGSAAMDSLGDVAIAYSVAGPSTSPGIRYAGHAASDPAGTIGQAETDSVAGAGAQTGTNRWGDYSSLSVDPSDGCTFWAAQQYYDSKSSVGWKTRITEFRFPGCTPAPGPSPATVSGPTLDRPFQTSDSIDLTWSEPDPGTFTYDVRYREAPWGAGFGSPVIWQQQTSATSATFVAHRGSTYCFSARATDGSSITGGWGAEACTAVPLDDRALKAAKGRWARKDGSAYYLGTFSRTSHHGNVLTKAKLSAKTIVLVATTCPGCGTVKATWNGVDIATLHLAAATTTHQVVIPLATLSAGQFGTLRLVVTSSSKPVTIEGLGISRV